LKINFSIDLLQRALNLPYGQKVIRKTIVGKLFIFLNKRQDIVISNDEGLIAVATQDKHLWFTALWNDRFASFLNVLCSVKAEEIITSYSSFCPFCGVDVVHACSHTMLCMMNYAQWAGGIRVNTSRLEIYTK